MQFPGYNTGNIILSEGDWFPFKIHNLVQLQDDEWYYVLIDVNGLKHFMPAAFYKNYGLTIGEELLCKIDRINCTGRIFLEPKHPLYCENESYFFDLAEVKPMVSSGESIYVKELFGNLIEVSALKKAADKIRFLDRKVRCVVKSIKKGLPILEIETE